MFKNETMKYLKIVNVLKIFVASHITHNVVNCSRYVMMFTVYARLLGYQCQKNIVIFSFTHNREKMGHYIIIISVESSP